jgi:hypothetical protein
VPGRADPASVFSRHAVMFAPLDRPHIDFAHDAFGAELADQFLARLGRPACPE